QAQSCDVGGYLVPGCHRCLVCLSVERIHWFHGFRRYLTGGLVLIVKDSDADSLGQGQWQTWLCGVIAHELGGVSGTGDGHAINWFWSGDGVSTSDRNSCFIAHVYATA